MTEAATTTSPRPPRYPRRPDARGAAAGARRHGRAGRARATASGRRPPTAPTRSRSWPAQATTRVPELVPDPLRAHGRVAVRLLPGRGRRDGRRPGRRRRTRGSTCSSAATPTWSNFGGFASPERDLVFDVNDFDETLPGPFEWDVKRLAASLEIAGRSRGFDDASARPDRGRAPCAPTARRCASFAAMRQPRRLVRPPRRRRHARAVGREAGSAGAEDASSGRVDKAESKDQLKAESKLTQVVDGELAVRQRPAAARAGRGARSPTSSAERSSESLIRGRCAQLPRTPCTTTGATCSSSYRVRRPGPQGGRGRQRRHPVLGGAAGRARRRRPAVPAGQGGRGLGARAVPAARASTPTTASGSSRASG